MGNFDIGLFYVLFVSDRLCPNDSVLMGLLCTEYSLLFVILQVALFDMKTKHLHGNFV